MNSIKAIISGTIFIIVASLLAQLAFIILVVGYNSLANDYPFLNEISWIFRYLIGIPVFIGIMFFGGYITGVMAKTKIFLHCLIVGVMTIGSTMWMALSNSDITSTGVVINSLMLVAIIAGGFYRNNNVRSTRAPTI